MSTQELNPSQSTQYNDHVDCDFVIIQAPSVIEMIRPKIVPRAPSFHLTGLNVTERDVDWTFEPSANLIFSQA